MRDIAIIGSGPAGLSASVYATRAGLSTFVYKGKTSGGLVTTTEQVDNYLGLPGSSGMSMAQLFLDHATEFGAEIKNGSATRISRNANGSFLVEDDRDGSENYRAVIFAAGSEPRKLGVPGEDLEGVSWCAVCDGTFSQDEEVIVVGGGESAVEEAVYMSNIASKVTVLVRGDDFRANRPAVESLLGRPNVDVRYGVSITEIIGDGSLESAKLSDGSVVPAYSIFEAIGQIPQSHVAKEHSEVYADGFISRSNTEGFFVAGDVADPEYRQVAIAVGDGAKAAIDAIRWLQMQPSIDS